MAQEVTMARLVLIGPGIVTLLMLGLSLAFSAEVPPLPVTPKKPATDEYHGIKVIDDYRWLENAADPAVRRWTEAQNRHTRAVLDQFPAMEALRKRVKELMSDTSPDYFSLRYEGGVLFALKSQPPKEQPFLITLPSADEPAAAHVVLDPNQLNTKGTTAIDFYVPSHDGRLVAVSLSQGGSEDGTVHVYEVAGGKELPDVVPRVNYPTGGGSLAWNGDGTGFYYTRYPRGNERPKEDLNFYQQVYFHKLGTPTSDDTYVIGKEFPRIAETTLQTTKDGRYVLASVANGDGGDFAHYLLTPAGRWIELAGDADKISAATFGPDDALYLFSRKDAPRGKILRLPLATPQLAQAKTVVPQSDAAIEGMVYDMTYGYGPNFVPTATRLYVVDQIGGPSQIRVFDHAGRFLQTVPIAEVSSVGQVLAGRGDELLYRNSSYLKPPAWYRFDPQTGKTTRTALYRTSPVDLSDCEVVREFATSKDGTKIPLNIIRRKGTKLDGRNPTLLTGYGGFGISMTPRFLGVGSIWLEQGGVYAIANLRGGREYGEEWHQAGNLTRKQNVFDDFTACAKHLIERRYTSPDRLAIEGGSNGGLLMGAVLTQHLELFRAVVGHVGIYDMLRSEQHPNGVFVVTEYGTVKDPEQFQAIYAYSPYQHVKDGTAYPAVFLLTGENDGRVDPANSKKMAARLQAATASKLPVLLQIGLDTGHGIGSGLSKAMEQVADVDAFLFQQLGVEYKKPLTEGNARP
jgi:prolyl oligopeptidase